LRIKGRLTKDIRINIDVYKTISLTSRVGSSSSGSNTRASNKVASQGRNIEIFINGMFAPVDQEIRKKL
jgi:hypothetical protein